MRPSTGLISFRALAFICLFFPFCAHLFAQRGSGSPNRSGSNSNTVRPPNFSVRGKVVDTQNRAQLENVRVELRTFTGVTVGTSFTHTGGDFEFLNVGVGSYELIVQQSGYHTVSQRLDVQDSVYGLSIDLHPSSTTETLAPGPSSVSARELTIPRKAHDDMEKGLGLLYEKSDYQGSIKQFERAIQEYPGYYEAYTQIGIADMHARNNAIAEQMLRKALELSHETDVDALSWLSTLLNDTQRFADAEPLARKGLELDSKSWQSNAELARALLGLHRPAEAEKSALAAAQLRPDNALLYLVLANIHTQLENAPALLEDLNNYLRLAPTGPMADQARAQRKQLQDELGDSQQTSPAPSLNR